MSRHAALCILILASCTSDPERLPAPRPGVTSSASSGGAGATGGEGGAGGLGGAASSSQASSSATGGAAPCDEWHDPTCCVESPECPPGSLGECTSQVRLCGGVCQGVAQPIPNKACNEGTGTCVGTECVAPVGGAGGQGGAGGAGGRP